MGEPTKSGREESLEALPIKISEMKATSMSTGQCVIFVSILFFINLLNYMDRFTVPAVLSSLQDYFGTRDEVTNVFTKLNDTKAGLLQTVFICFFMVFAPLCGYFGDRYNRKMIMIGGLLVWVLAVLASTFVESGHFWLFLFLRGLVGVGEASYSTVAPTLIADLFVSTLRSRILMIFYFAIPFGSGLGFIASGYMEKLLGHWSWGVRVTPPLGFIAILALIFFVSEPERGLAEREYAQLLKQRRHKSGQTHVQSDENGRGINDKRVAMRNGDVTIEDDVIANDFNQRVGTTYIGELKYLCAKRSYLWLIVGYTAMIFLVGTLSWFAAAAIQYSVAAHWKLNTTDVSELNKTAILQHDPKLLKTVEDFKSEKSRISTTFGVIMCFSGLLGVSLGVFLAEMWKNGKYCFRACSTIRADALISAIGSLLSLPFLYANYYFTDKNLTLAWVLLFLGMLSLCLNWAIVVDLLMYIIVPWRRNLANSWLILISHMFGDASGPYIIGSISDCLRGDDDRPQARYNSLIYSFYTTNLVLLLSSFAFFMVAYYLPRDVRAFQQEMGMLSETIVSANRTQGFRIELSVGTKPKEEV